MTLYEINNAIEESSITHPFVNEYGEGDIYDHLNSGEHKYATVFLTVDNVVADDDFQTLHGSLFFVDRLTADQSNRLQIQSRGITVLQQILNRLQNLYPSLIIESEQYNVFTAKFSDMCAGVYSTVAIKFENTDGLCDDIYE